MANLQSKLYQTFDDDPAPITRFVQWLAASYELTGSLHVLDVGCGPGRMLREYAALGWQVTGLEPDADFYAEAAEMVRELPQAAVRQGGFGDIDEVAVFDLATAVNGPFAYLLTREEQSDALVRLFRALRPGGVMFLDLPNLLWFLKHEPDVQYEGVREVDGREVRFLSYYEWDFHDAIFRQINQYIIEAGEEPERLSNTHRHVIVSRPELSRLVRRAGFVDLRTYNDYSSRQPERLTASRLMLAARKPEAAHGR